MDAWVWILLVVVVVAIVAAVLATRSRQRENRRAEAADLRDPSAEHHMELREKEAAAAASEADARRTRAEADQRAAEAQHLEVQAERAAKEREAAAAESEAKLRRADALDPDVRTDKEGYRLDENGNRVGTAGAGLGTSAAAGAGAMAAGAEARTDRDLDGDGDVDMNGDRSVAGSDHAREPGLEHGHADGRPTEVPEATPVGLVGNMRDLDDDAPAGATPAGDSPAGATTAGATATTPPATPGLDEDGPGRSDDAPVEGFHPEHRIGNIRDLDDDGRETTAHADSTRTDADPVTSDETVVEGDRDGDGDRDARDTARERADDVLSRREADRRQPE